MGKRRNDKKKSKLSRPRPSTFKPKGKQKGKRMLKQHKSQESDDDDLFQKLTFPPAKGFPIKANLILPASLFPPTTPKSFNKDRMQKKHGQGCSLDPDDFDDIDVDADPAAMSKYMRYQSIRTSMAASKLSSMASPKRITRAMVKQSELKAFHLATTSPLDDDEDDDEGLLLEDNSDDDREGLLQDMAEQGLLLDDDLDDDEGLLSNDDFEEQAELERSMNRLKEVAAEMTENFKTEGTNEEWKSAFSQNCKKCHGCGHSYETTKEAFNCFDEHEDVVCCLICFKVFEQIKTQPDYTPASKLYRHYTETHWDSSLNSEHKLTCPHCERQIPYQDMSLHILCSHVSALNRAEKGQKEENGPTLKKVYLTPTVATKKKEREVEDDDRESKDDSGDPIDEDSSEEDSTEDESDEDLNLSDYEENDSKDGKYYK